MEKNKNISYVNEINFNNRFFILNLLFNLKSFYKNTLSLKTYKKKVSFFYKKTFAFVLNFFFSFIKQLLHKLGYLLFENVVMYNKTNIQNIL